MAQPYELLVRMNPDGTVRGASTKTISDVGGTDVVSDPVPLIGTDDPAFSDFADQFAASVVAERDRLLAQVDSLREERDAAQAKVEPLETEVAALQAELEALRNPPFDPRVVSPYAFVNRYTMDERIAILQAAKTDVQVELILSELQTVARVRLDVEATKNGVNYLASIGVISESRVSEILADATADEAPQ